VWEDIDLDQIAQHCHSDQEEKDDDDPYYEYNKCNTFTFLEKKLAENFEKFEKVEISKFGLPKVEHYD